MNDAGVCLFSDDVVSKGQRHSSCDVVAVCACQAVPPGTELPAVCPCECQTCKREWFAFGRPRIVDGKVVRG